MPLSLATAPTAEPITLAQAKAQTRRVEVEDDDGYLLDTLIPAVRERAEQTTRRQFITATWDLTLDGFPCGDLEVPLPPLQAVSYIRYVDANGTTQTLATNQYVVDAPGVVVVDPGIPEYRVLGRQRRGRISRAYGVSWPTTRTQINAVTIRFLAGYGARDTDIPPRLKMGMLLDLGTLFENREDHVVGQGYAITPFPNGAEAVYRAFMDRATT